MQKRSAAAQISRHGKRHCMTRAASLLLCFVVMASMISMSSVASAGLFDVDLSDWQSTISGWIGNSSNTTTSNTWNQVDNSDRSYTVNNAQNYYTSVTSSVVDKSGNVTNYYRGGDTTNTKIIDSYNKTFNTVYNTTNTSTTNNYKANVKLENFLNQYTTNNVTNNNTYSTTYKSWYYDNRTSNYNYTENNDYNYYNYDNSRYYISIDNSTDEYYLIDVQYSPTFVTVNYTYNTTNINNEKVGDVTNVYYYELKDGRNSSSLTAAEVAGLDLGYDVVNYELVTDDPNTLSLQHFDGDYTDSSSYGRNFYSQNRSTTYVDSGAFGKAVSLPNGSAAGVTIPNLSGYDSLSFDFRIYYNDISNLGVYFGDTNIFQEVPVSRKWVIQDIFSDDGVQVPRDRSDLGLTADRRSSWPDVYYRYMSRDIGFVVGQLYLENDILDPPFRYYSSGTGFSYSWSSTVSNFGVVPVLWNSPGYSSNSNKVFGWFVNTGAPQLYSSNYVRGLECFSVLENGLAGRFFLRNRLNKEYRWSPSRYVLADFSYDSYKSQWVFMRITIANGNIYYFVNGDLVGSGTFTKPTADKFYIKSTGTVYLDELRVTTGNLSSTSAYTPSSAPYDTNKVLALPDELKANTIYVQHTTPVANHRIGGVRPSNPETGYFYIPLYDDNTGGQPQLYDGSNWVNVTAMVYDGTSLKNAMGFKFSPVGDAPDVNVDAKPEHPTKPVDPEKCTHEWEETDRTEPTCILAGSVEYTCSKCEKTKTETLPKLGHTWEVKQSVQTTYDEEGNVLTQGFTIYRCPTCGEEYKDTNGTGPPGGGGGSGAGDVDDDVLDKFPSFVNMVLSMFQQLPKLFEGFAAFLTAVFAYVPEDVILLLTFGVAAVVLIGIIKAVRG